EDAVQTQARGGRVRGRAPAGQVRVRLWNGCQRRLAEPAGGLRGERLSMLGIIGGTGLTQLANLQISHREVVRTPYGEPSGALTFGRLNGREVVFIARHGYGHTIPPHAVNYRANIWALHSRNVSRVVSVASVGGIRSDLKPGALALP